MKPAFSAKQRSLYIRRRYSFYSCPIPICGLCDRNCGKRPRAFPQVVEMKGNLQRITIPVSESFAPNAFVCVHVIEKVEGDAVPAERFGSCEIKVDQPGQRLQVIAMLNADVLEPGSNVSGVVKVSAQDKPVAGADVCFLLSMKRRWRWADGSYRISTPRFILRVPGKSLLTVRWASFGLPTNRPSYRIRKKDLFWETLEPGAEKLCFGRTSSRWHFGMHRCAPIPMAKSRFTSRRRKV